MHAICTEHWQMIPIKIASRSRFDTLQIDFALMSKPVDIGDARLPRDIGHTAAGFVVPAAQVQDGAASTITACVEGVNNDGFTVK